MSLIQRLEQLNGPDREVDAEIYRLIRGDKRPQGFWYFSGLRERGETEETTWIEWSIRKSPRYTASIDAALTLVPQGWEWQCSNRAKSPHTGRAYMHNRHNHFVGVGSCPNPDYVSYEFTAATPALALCIAALKARGVK